MFFGIDVNFQMTRRKKILYFHFNGPIEILVHISKIVEHKVDDIEIQGPC